MAIRVLNDDPDCREQADCRMRKPGLCAACRAQAAPKRHRRIKRKARKVSTPRHVRKARAPAKPRPADAPVVNGGDPACSGEQLVSVNLDRGEVRFDGKMTYLGGKALKLVAVAAKQFGKQLRRDFLIDQLWGEDRPSTADTLLSVAITQSNDRLRGMGLELKTERGAGCALQKVEGQ